MLNLPPGQIAKLDTSAPRGVLSWPGLASRGFPNPAWLQHGDEISTRMDWPAGAGKPAPGLGRSGEMGGGRGLGGNREWGSALKLVRGLCTGCRWLMGGQIKGGGQGLTGA